MNGARTVNMMDDDEMSMATTTRVSICYARFLSGKREKREEKRKERASERERERVLTFAPGAPATSTTTAAGAAVAGAAMREAPAPIALASARVISEDPGASCSISADLDSELSRSITKDFVFSHFTVRQYRAVLSATVPGRTVLPGIPGSLVLYGTKSKKPLGGSKGIKGANAQLQLAHEVWLQ